MTRLSEPIYLLNAANKPVLGTLSHSISDKNLLDWVIHWKSFMQQRITSGQLAAMPQHPHWNWVAKYRAFSGSLAMKSFAIDCDDMTQGMMWVNVASFSRHAATLRNPLVYIEFLESAPWNLPMLNSAPKFKGVGGLMIAAAIHLSKNEEFKGRIGLHALPQAEPFYANKCGMTDFGHDPEHHGLRYFEMTSAQAEAFINLGEGK